MKPRCFSLESLLTLSALSVLMLLAASPGRAQSGGTPGTPGTPVTPGQATQGTPAPLTPTPLPLDLSVIHLDTPVIPAKGGLDGYLDIRTFGGDEDLLYTSIGVQYGFGNSWSGVLRGTFAGRDNLSVAGGAAFIRHGGSDVELAARYQLPRDPRFAGLVGISFPHTAAQSDPVITLGASAAFPLGKRATGYLNPKTVLLKDNLLLGLGIGVRATLSERISLLADITPLLAGQNTRSTDDGDRERRLVYGIGFRFARPASPLSFDIGYANGTGRTTGSSLTPGLGGAGAIYAGLTLRR